MTRTKLYILPARNAPELILPEEPSRPVKRARLYDANGTEFVGLVECSTCIDPDNPTIYRRVSLELRLNHGESRVVDDPPESLQDRLRALVAEWNKVEKFEASDNEGVAAKRARMDCSDDLEALLNAMESAE